MLALRRAPGARSLSAVFDGRVLSELQLWPRQGYVPMTSETSASGAALQEPGREVAVARLKARKRAVWIAFFLGPLVTVGAGAIDPQLAPVAFGLWGVAFVITSFRSWFTACPACGRLFHLSENLVSNPFATSCMKCGFRL